MHTERMSCEGEGRDPGNVSLSQRMPKIASKPLEGRGKAWNRFFLTALRRKKLGQHLNLELLASKTVR